MSLYWISSNFGRTQNLHKGSVPLVTYSTGPSKLQFSSFNHFNLLFTYMFINSNLCERNVAAKVLMVAALKWTKMEPLMAYRRMEF